MNILFICTYNKWRSLTAEHLFQNKPGFSVRSAGTASTARIVIKESLILWADVIFVMENCHKEILQKKFESALEGKRLVVLDIDSGYRYNDPELVEIFSTKVPLYIPKYK